MLRRKHKEKQAESRRSDQPGNLLELNKSLSGYSYHPSSGRAILNPEPEHKQHSFSWKKFLKRSVLTVVILALVTGGWLGWKLLSNELKVFGWKGLVSLVHPTKLKGEDSGHVTILIAGDSSDDPGHQGANLTDSIMLVSLNTNNNTAFMLSIPRDLYVNIPGNGYAKINEAFQDGNNENFSAPGYPSGGIGLLEETVSQITGTPIDYYAVVNYGAVRDAVNAIGGINIDVKSSDPRGLYDPSPDYDNGGQPLVNLTNGEHTIHGVQALGLSRARGDTYGAYGYAASDFTRTQNQRFILLGIKDKAMSLGTLSNPVKLGNLFDSFGNNIKTDMTLGNIVRAYDLAKKLPDSKITSAGLNDANGTDLLTSYYTSSGEDALVPKTGVGDYSAIQGYIQTLYNPTTTPATTP